MDRLYKDIFYQVGLCLSLVLLVHLILLVFCEQMPLLFLLVCLVGR